MPVAHIVAHFWYTIQMFDKFFPKTGRFSSAALLFSIKDVPFIRAVNMFFLKVFRSFIYCESILSFLISMTDKTKHIIVCTRRKFKRRHCIVFFSDLDLCACLVPSTHAMLHYAWSTPDTEINARLSPPLPPLAHSAFHLHILLFPPVIIYEGLYAHIRGRLFEVWQMQSISDNGFSRVGRVASWRQTLKMFVNELLFLATFRFIHLS